LDIIWVLREVAMLTVVWLWIRVIVEEGRLSHHWGLCVLVVHGELGVVVLVVRLDGTVKCQSQSLFPPLIPALSTAGPSGMLDIRTVAVGLYDSKWLINICFEEKTSFLGEDVDWKSGRKRCGM
jgi:hypothetical protein